MQEKAKSITLLTHIILSCLMRSGANLQCSALGSELLEQVNTAKYHTASLSWVALSPWLSVPSPLWTFHKAQNRDDYVKNKELASCSEWHAAASSPLFCWGWGSEGKHSVLAWGRAQVSIFRLLFQRDVERSAHDSHHSAVKLTLQAQLKQCSSFPW